MLNQQELVGFERDNLHREQARRLQNGLEQHTAFDPAGNILDPKQIQQVQRDHKLDDHVEAAKSVSKLLGNLLKDYAGTHFDYDDRGNLIRKPQNGQTTEYEWDAFNRLAKLKTPKGETEYRYDGLGRRIAKLQNTTDGTKRTEYLWDGDVLAIETTDEKSTHYLFEPDSFIPLAQFEAGSVQAIDTPKQSPTEYRHYEADKDPLNRLPERPSTQPNRQESKPRSGSRTVL